MTGFLILAFLILFAGLVSVPIAARLGLGSVLGYLLAGMAIAPVLATLGADVEQLQVFAEFGVVMMLFIVGLELEPKTLWAMRGKLLGTGGGQVVLTTLALAAVALASGNPWQTALAIGMILALSSTAIVVQSLTEKGLLKSSGGESAFSVLLFQDVAVIPILALLPLLALPGLGFAGGEGAHGSSLDLTADMPALLAALVRIGAVVAVVLIGNYLTRPVFRFIAGANLRELFTAAGLMFVIGIALLMTLVGLSPALGTFLAGVVLANSEYRHELESDVDPFKGLLLGLFFITVGAGINFGLALERFGEVVFWAAVTIAVKVAVLLLVGRLSGLKREALWLFALSLPQAGEFGLVLIAFALGNAILPAPLAELLLVVVALTMLATPLLFILYDKGIARLYCNRQAEREADAIEEENPIIIAGRGRVGGIVDRMLDAAGHRATVIDYDSEHIEQLKRFGVKSFFGDATRPDLLASAGIARAKLLIVALDEREQIDKLVRYAVGNFPNLHVIARAKDRDHVYHLWALGCRDVVRETYDSALRMGRSAYEALGVDHQNAQAMADAWEERDRSSMREVADLYRLDVPTWENEPLLAKIKELRREWDPKLREQMDEIVSRGEGAVTTGTHQYVPDSRNESVLIDINGEHVARPDAKISVFDSGFMLGDGVWEGIRLHGGRLAFLDRHLDRLWRGAKAIALDIGISREELERRLYAVLDANGMTDEGAHVRLMVTRGVRSTPYQDPRVVVGGATIVIIPEWKAPAPDTATRMLKLFTVHVRRGYPDVQDPMLNSHSKLNCITACIQAAQAGADEGLMLDPHGFVATCNSTHFFVVTGGEVWTSSGDYCLDGITRGVVIEIAREAGLTVRERNFSLTHVYGAEEAFCTGTFAGLAPVGSVDGRVLGTERGPVVEQLQQLYRERVARDVAARSRP